MIYAIIGIIVLIALYFLVTYNSFIKLKNMVEEAFATMDVYLKKRWDLVPNLVETVKGYAKHESSVLEQVVALRNSPYEKMSTTEKIEANQQLTSGLSKLIAIGENYPDLKASQNFANLTAELSRLEDEIANSRKYYNAVVRNLNNKVQMFPSNIVANMFHFEQAKMFEANEEEKNNVKVEF